MVSIWSLIISDVRYHTRASSLHNFNPRFSPSFHLLITRDSRNDGFSQLSDLLITSVFLRTQLIWILIFSSSKPPVWKIPTMSFLIALSGWVQPCYLVLWNMVFCFSYIGRVATPFLSNSGVIYRFTCPGWNSVNCLCRKNRKHHVQQNQATWLDPTW